MRFVFATVGADASGISTGAKQGSNPFLQHGCYKRPQNVNSSFQYCTGAFSGSLLLSQPASAVIPKATGLLSLHSLLKEIGIVSLAL